MVAARAATETERMRNTLLASISHDFRTPLSSILGSATSLIDYGHKLAPANHRDLLGHIKREAEDLDGMVRNLLAVTRIDAGALELQTRLGGLAGSDRARGDRGATARRRRRVRTELPPELPLLRADPTLVEQALTNVVGNAITHTPEGTGVAIDVEVARGQVLRCASLTTDPGISHADAAPHLRQVRPGRARPMPTGARDPASGSPSPRAFWRRMVAASRRKARSQAAEARA